MFSGLLVRVGGVGETYFHLGHSCVSTSLNEWHIPPSPADARFEIYMCKYREESNSIVEYSIVSHNSSISTIPFLRRVVLSVQFVPTPVPFFLGSWKIFVLSVMFVRLFNSSLYRLLFSPEKIGANLRPVSLCDSLLCLILPIKGMLVLERVHILCVRCSLAFHLPVCAFPRTYFFGKLFLVIVGHNHI